MQRGEAGRGSRGKAKEGEMEHLGKARGRERLRGPPSNFKIASSVPTRKQRQCKNPYPSNTLRVTVS